MSTAKKGMKKSTYLIIWTLVIALLCSAVGVVNYEALYWDSALTLYFGEVGVKNVSTVTPDRYFDDEVFAALARAVACCTVHAIFRRVFALEAEIQQRVHV